MACTGPQCLHKGALFFTKMQHKNWHSKGYMLKVNLPNDISIYIYIYLGFIHYQNALFTAVFIASMS